MDGWMCGVMITPPEDRIWI